jgi:hypothetical protein
MLVILASRWNKTASTLASSCAGRDVKVLTPRDLSVAGWRQYLGGMKDGAVVVDGRPVDQREITGVLTLLPCVVEDELVDIVPGDRRYVASEMTAFLLFWLSRLQCPVLNRPTPTCLSGPYWRQEKWVHAAAQAGLPVQPVRRFAPLDPCAKEEMTPSSCKVTVIGNRIFGETDPNLHLHAQRLAGLAGVELLSVQFSGPDADARFLSAETFPSFMEPGMADAALEYLQDERARCE